MSAETGHPRLDASQRLIDAYAQAAVSVIHERSGDFDGDKLKLQAELNDYAKHLGVVAPNVVEETYDD